MNFYIAPNPFPDTGADAVLMIEDCVIALYRGIFESVEVFGLLLQTAFEEHFALDDYTIIMITSRLEGLGLITIHNGVPK